MGDSVRAAFEAGYDFVEVDVRTTADGRLVVHHDPLTSSGRPIAELSWDQYRLASGEEALLFETVLDLAARFSGRLHVDLKQPGCEAEVVRLLLKQLALDRFVVTGGDAAVRAVKAAFPEVRAGLSLGDDVDGQPPWRQLRVRLSELFPAPRVRACGADFVAVNYRLAAAGVLRYCGRAGLPAWVWTVDDEVQMTRFLNDPRVTVLITNRPDLARRLRQPRPEYRGRS